MARATKTQKSQHLNAAHGLLARGNTMAQAAATLSRERGISLRQAYRYVEQAREIGHAVPVVEASVPVTFKIPGVVIDQLRAYSAASRLTLSEIVTRALETFLTAVRRRGRHG
jgi:predicted DNA-binding transcriptional regulator YafY